MRRYFARKLLVYALTFVVAVTVNWMIPRFMPGDPVAAMVARARVSQPEAAEAMRTYYNNLFGFDEPLWQQYLHFWGALLQGDFGISIWVFPTPVGDVLLDALPYTLGLMIPSVLLSWFVGNWIGALSARRKVLDNTVLPVGYVLTAMPYMWIAVILAWALGGQAGWFPLSGGYSLDIQPGWNTAFALDALHHWVLPFLSLFLVALGGWAIGMRNMIIYELESDYSSYLSALGAPQRLIRRYAFRNAVLPQVTGLALQLGVLVAGALVTEIVFAYPGLGSLILASIQNQDFFLLQGAFLFIVIGVLIANFLIDVVYVVVDPRTRTGMAGGTS
ncbi:MULTISPECIES: ABC transporter permease [Streptomyces]|uniref:ABC transporter permease n=1 Tax=Streptomyces TaxID=1883 RepID=UPI000490CFCF|nr:MULTISPECIES: ABC transporter permease [Streptomyces]MYR75909.1 ABC transporter permease subunit [Streptomyces sp. SID4925]MYY17810.1 ABC transporter permease subunit [Streptomyces sp. SID4912]SBU96953.1 peptide/nickel transport system permease protein [Streptomyces sp. OspMP-M45]SCD96588.1 peptide/nickel transport system permease protein [Streptomyces sp. DpondAA-D4]